MNSEVVSVGKRCLYYAAVLTCFCMFSINDRANSQGNSDPQARSLIESAVQSLDNTLENIVYVFRYQRMLPSEPENPWTSDSVSSDYTGSYRKFGIYAQLGQRKVLEQMTWGYYVNKDNSSDHEIYFYDGQNTYTWSGWNNSGQVIPGEHQQIRGMGFPSVFFYSFGGIPLSHLLNSYELTNVHRILINEGREAIWTLDVIKPSKPDHRYRLELSETYDFFPRMIQDYYQDTLIIKQEILEFMPVVQEAPSNLSWFPRKATHWASYVSPRLKRPLPPTEAEILKVSVGTLKDEDFERFVFPRGVLLADETTGASMGYPDEHIPFSRLKPEEIPSYFPKLGMGIKLEEAKAWVENH